LIETLKLTNFGNSVRDFTYISDIVEGIIAALNLDTNRSDLFNLGGNNPIKLTYFVKLLEEGLQKEATKELVPIQEGDVPLTYANVTKAGIFLGWSPKIPIEEGVQQFLNWYTNHGASKFMSPPKKEVCVITASFAKEANSMDKVFDVSAYKKRDENLAFYYFSNLDLDW
jgi:dTDP-D-glucose 4,6-dehydratase